LGGGRRDMGGRHEWTRLDLFITPPLYHWNNYVDSYQLRHVRSGSASRLRNLRLWCFAFPAQLARRRLLHRAAAVASYEQSPLIPPLPPQQRSFVSRAPSFCACNPCIGTPRTRVVHLCIPMAYSNCLSDRRLEELGEKSTGPSSLEELYLP